MQAELEYVIRFTVFSRNSVNNIKTKCASKNLGHADIMGKKILSHILAANDLLKKYRSEITETILCGNIDYSSIYVLLRSALETYLTFHNIYISAKNPTESSFRFNCWALYGFTDRNRFTPESKEASEFMNIQIVEEKILREDIKNSPFFKQFDSKSQKQLLKGIWRMEKSWVDLGVEAGYSRNYIGKQYSFLSWHVHASINSIAQINTDRKTDSNEGHLNITYSIMLSILSKFNYDYINLIPELNHFSHKGGAYELILIWKQIVETTDN